MRNRSLFARGAGLSGAVVVLTLWLSAAGSNIASAAHKADESQLKAAMIYRLATFVRWDEESLPGDSIDICVIGDEGMASALEKIVSSRKLAGRTADVRRAAEVSAIAVDCPFVFLGHGDAGTLDALLERFESNVLTMSDMPKFAQQGGMIEIRMVGRKRLKFEINRRAIEHAKLEVSSRLLELAEKIHLVAPGGK